MIGYFVRSRSLQQSCCTSRYSSTAARSLSLLVVCVYVMLLYTRMLKQEHVVWPTYILLVGFKLSNFYVSHPLFGIAPPPTLFP